MITFRNQPLQRKISSFLGKFSCLFGFHPCVQASDLNGCWGECIRCHRRFGYVTREELRSYIDHWEEQALPKKAPHIITQPLGQARPDPVELPTSPYWLSYLSGYGGNCRECGDSGPVCPYKGLACSHTDRINSIRHILDGINYGLRYGYLDLTGLDPMKAEFRIPPKDPNP